MSPLRFILTAALLFPLATELQAQIPSGLLGSQRPPKLDTKELSKPIVIEPLGIVSPGGFLPDSGAIRLRLTNPNRYTVLFQIRPVKDHLYTGNRWKVYNATKKLWLWQTRKPFGGKMRDYSLEPGQSVEVLAAFFHRDEDHDIYITFRKAGDRLTLSNQLVYKYRPRGPR